LDRGGGWRGGGGFAGRGRKTASVGEGEILKKILGGGSPPPPPPSLRKIPDVTHVCIQYIYHVGHVWQHAIQVIVFRCSLHLVEKAVLLLMLFSEVMIVIEIVE